MSTVTDVPAPEVKPGYITTEFWTTLAALVGNVIVVLTVLGRISPEQAKQLSSAFTDLYTTIPLLLTNAWMLWHYVSSRTSLKQTVANADIQRQLAAISAAIAVVPAKDAPKG